MGVGPKNYGGRKWYPSGPRIDGSSSSSPEPRLPNPDPDNYKIVKAQEEGKYLVIKINYPDCTNYEGNKILVFESSLLDIVNQKVIDPHFFENKKIKSPVARFVPSDKGWNMAVKFAKMMNGA